MVRRVITFYIQLHLSKLLTGFLIINHGLLIKIACNSSDYLFFNRKLFTTYYTEAKFRYLEPVHLFSLTTEMIKQ